MPVTSRIGVAQDALLALLTAREALDGVAIALGWPTPTPEPEQIWVAGDVSEWTSEWETNDPEREERFTIPVKFLVQQSTIDYAEVRDRMLALVGELEQTVRANPDLTDSVWDAEIRGGEMSEYVFSDGRGLQATVNVLCRAHLQ